MSTDKVPEGKKCDAALRDMIQVIQKDLLDDIRTYESATITVDDLFRSFMDMRVNPRETTRCTYTTLYQNHVSDVIGHGAHFRMFARTTVQNRKNATP